jgi:hypothetical protein
MKVGIAGQIGNVLIRIAGEMTTGLDRSDMSDSPIMDISPTLRRRYEREIRGKLQVFLFRKVSCSSTSAVDGHRNPKLFACDFVA